LRINVQNGDADACKKHRSQQQGRALRIAKAFADQPLDWRMVSQSQDRHTGKASLVRNGPSPSHLPNSLPRFLLVVPNPGRDRIGTAGHWFDNHRFATHLSREKKSTGNQILNESL
jgi:hypothetical protein